MSFFTKKKKKVGVSNGKKILFSGKTVKSYSSNKTWHYFFIFLITNDQQLIPISGSANMRAEKRMARRIAHFLNFPVLCKNTCPTQKSIRT